MMNTWRIVHIPDKPHHPPDQQPTVDVVAVVIEPKHANTLIRRLNPLENMRHLKRVQKKHLEGGKTQLSVILCLASEKDNLLDGMPHDVKELINSYQSANMLHHQKKSGKNNVSYGQHHIIPQPNCASTALRNSIAQSRETNDKNSIKKNVEQWL